MSITHPLRPVAVLTLLMASPSVAAAEIASMSGTSSGDEGDSYSYTCTWNDTEEKITFTWDFGDGDTETDVVNANSGATSSVSHTFVDDGAYKVTCTATGHDSNDTDADDVSVSVANVAPVASAAGDTAGDEGETLGFSCSASDVGVEDSVTYAWDFGDGATTSGATASHVFDDDGTYTVVCTATDDGGDSGADAVTVVVDNVTPEIVALSGATSGDEGDTLSWAVTATDAGSADTLSYSWDFADGGTATGASVTHTYTDQGSYALEVVACDDEGACTTEDRTITVANVAPTAALTGDTSGAEGAALSWSCATSDPGADDVVSVSWDFGDGQTGAGSAASHTFADDGSYVVTCIATDDYGDTGSDAVTVLVANEAPTITSTTVPASGTEGETLDFEVVVTDPGTGDSLSVSWDFGDGAIATGTSASHSFDDDGSYTVTVTVCDDSSDCDTSSSVVAIGNADPVVDSVSVAASADEAEAVVLSAVATDAGDDTLVYTWDFGDGDTDIGDSVSHAWADQGTYAITLTVTDGDGGSDAASSVIDIANVAPSIDSLGCGEGAEGEALQFDVFASDVGVDDTLAVSWDFGDGGSATGDSAEHTYGDDGSYTITVTVDDGDDTTVEDCAIAVSNAAPVLSGTPAASVVEATDYSFTVGLDDPGSLDTHTFSATLPDGASFDAASQTVSWVPGWTDLGVHDLSLEVIDDDGASDSMSWQVEVLMADADGDGLSDGWEADHGLDPDDSADAEVDTDGDGRTNAEEYERGTDPNVYDGPSVPELATPEDGAEWEELALVLSVHNATSPDGEALSYELALYSDAELTALVDEIVGLEEGDDGLTSWTVGAALTENTWYHWWAAAADPFITGDWSAPAAFFYNTANDAPGQPGLVSPFDASTVDDTVVTLVMDAASDVDEDALTYTLELGDDLGFVLESIDGLEAVDSQVAWTPETELAEGVVYCWTAFATDEHGESGEAPESACFTVDTDNQAPEAPVILSPEEGLAVNTVLPEILVANGVDPEGRATEHLFELDIDPAFGSEAYQVALVASGEEGTTAWLPEALTDNTWHHLRVTASDGAAWSESAEVRFVVNVENDAPGVPTLQNPADGAPAAKDCAFSLVNTTDADEDALTYEFLVMDAATGEAVQSAVVDEDPSGVTGWLAEHMPPGSYTWTARAIDSYGLAGEWAEARGFHIEERVEPEAESFCGCASGTSPSGLAWSLLALGLVAIRRRSVDVP